MSPTTVLIPGIVAHLERFLRPLAATSGAGVEIRQTERGTTVSACEGRHAATITTSTAGALDPILVDPAALAGIDSSKPAKLYRMSDTSAAIALGDGTLATVSITPGTLPRSAKDLADVVAGEVASGMTRAVFEVDPRHLLAVAESLVATGAAKATIAVAPRWNVLAATAETPEVAATFLVAGETFEITAPPAGELDDHGDDDPLAFTIEGRPRKSASSSRRQHVDTDEFLEGLPF